MDTWNNICYLIHVILSIYFLKAILHLVKITWTPRMENALFTKNYMKASGYTRKRYNRRWLFQRIHQKFMLINILSSHNVAYQSIYIEIKGSFWSKTKLIFIPYCTSILKEMRVQSKWSEITNLRLSCLMLCMTYSVNRCMSTLRIEIHKDRDMKGKSAAYYDKKEIVGMKLRDNFLRKNMRLLNT